MTIEIGPSQASVPSVTALIFFTIHKIKESDSNNIIKIKVQAEIVPHSLRCAVHSDDLSSDYLRDGAEQYL